MKEKFSVSEILQAVNLLTDNSVKLKEKIEISIDPQTEKIILQAEEFLHKKQKKNIETNIVNERDDVYLLNEEVPYLLNEKTTKKSD